MRFKRFKEDIDSFLARDPAARSRLEVALCYPGYHALLFYRLSNWLWRGNWRVLGRFISSIGRLITLIEIHPGASIGRRFVIDHGSAIVIGETSIIGDDVTLYQGVTLGGVSPSEDSHKQVDQKRHPTLASKVIIGSGAQILGPITVREGARVGANAVVTKDVPEAVTVVGIPGRVIPRSTENVGAEFSPYGTPIGDIPDPIARALEGLMDQVTMLRARIDELESQPLPPKDSFEGSDFVDSVARNQEQSEI